MSQVIPGQKGHTSLGFSCPRISQNKRATWVDPLCMEWLMLRDILEFPGIGPVRIRDKEP